MAAFVATAAWLATATAGCGGPGHLSQSSSAAASASTTVVVHPQVPTGGRAVLGAVLSGLGSSFKPPLEPSYQPYSGNCAQLVDPAFRGKCVSAVGAGGEVAGIVEVETGGAGKVRQERDLVWRRAGRRWALAEVHVSNVCLNGLGCSASPGLPTLLWRDDLARNGTPGLVFVLPSDRPGFARELDVVPEDGKVALYRDLGGGFAVAASGGGLVAYTPGASEAVPADNLFDQVLVRWSNGHWRLVSDQYVPYPAAMAQHRGAFYDPHAVPAKA